MLGRFLVAIKQTARILNDKERRGGFTLLLETIGNKGVHDPIFCFSLYKIGTIAWRFEANLKPKGVFPLTAWTWLKLICLTKRVIKWWIAKNYTYNLWMKRDGCTFMLSFEKDNFISHSNTGEKSLNLLYFARIF